MQKKALKILGMVIVVFIISAFSIRYYIDNGGKRDIASETAAFAVDSKSIVSEFTKNQEASNKKYLEKPVSVSGTITSINDKEVILDESVNCNFIKFEGNLKKDQKVIIKGRVVGYDDLLGELKLDQCSTTAN
ncbi:MAG TPA: hypothetical protein PKN96_04490 [Flavobacterium sp.]|uniref:OB-fold protein n=1 Tax=Flavobacterium sp. TaxID=239 RepID=UPI002BB0EA9B|nr:hypothetical protein [Flavobacterium sp.]HNP32526.1 hypothetical protein [Flavobacterium sp.]